MPKTLSAADVEDFRSRLCDVAERLFAAHGPDGVTMREMADALAVSSMTPYRYFKDKDAILAAVRTRAFNRFAAAMERARASPGPRSGNAYLDFALANPASYRLMFDVSQPTFANYPDLVKAMDRARRGVPNPAYDAAIARGREWIEGMQSKDGGWAAFDVNNLEYYLNNIPFSDHGALLDPPTEDVTARCVSMLAQLGETAQTSKAVADGIEYLRRTQLAEGSWYGRWGLNYIYGTWSVLSALNAAGVSHQDPMMRKAVDWLVSIQNTDGGWGEDATSYRLDYKGFDGAPTTASQTAWALLGLMAAGEVENPAVLRGVEYLKSTQTEKGLWDEQRYTATGFPRVFYLRYHGYSKFFPLWALARYRNLNSTNSRVVGVGM